MTVKPDFAAANTDQEIWRERADDYYSPSIHVTKEGGIGINVGGVVLVAAIDSWHTALRDYSAMAEDYERLKQDFEYKNKQLGAAILRTSKAEAEVGRLERRVDAENEEGGTFRSLWKMAEAELSSLRSEAEAARKECEAWAKTAHDLSVELSKMKGDKK